MNIADAQLNSDATEFNTKRKTLLGIEIVNQVANTPPAFLSALEIMISNAIENMGQTASTKLTCVLFAATDAPVVGVSMDGEVALG